MDPGGGLRRSLRLAANLAWWFACLPDHLALRRATRRVHAVQHRLLSDILAANRDTAFGRQHGFAAIRTPADFRRHVPMGAYDDYAPWIARLDAGEQAVLTHEPVPFLQPSSGSTRATKLLPFSAGLRRDFRRAIRAWIFDLFRTCPGLFSGSSYWSITPAMAQAQRVRAAGSLPISHDDEGNYLAPLDRLALWLGWAVPPAVSGLSDVDDFRYATLFHLLRARDLRLLSAWSPSFLLLLFDGLPARIESLISDLHHGRLAGLRNTPPERVEALARDLAPDPRRADELRSIWSAGHAPTATRLRLTWPRLSLISVWADGPAAEPLAALRQRFPDVRIQPKGLIATEAFVSLPWTGHEAPGAALLALRSHYFEFLPHGWGRPDDCFEAHQLEPGRDYEVVVTTSGGLYRYRLFDAVRVVGHHHQAPLLRFLGRTDHVVDRAGEKLNAAHVGDVLARLERRHGLQPAFRLLAPERHGDRHRYTLFLQVAPGAEVPASLADELDSLLAENYHYDYCRRLGQLAAPVVTRLDGGDMAPHALVLRHLGGERRMGGVKPAVLDGRCDWREVLTRTAAPDRATTPS